MNGSRIAWSSKENDAAGSTLVLRGEKHAESRKSLSVELNRRTGRQNFERDDQKWEKDDWVVVGEAEWERRMEQEADVGAYES